MVSMAARSSLHSPFTSFSSAAQCHAVSNVILQNRVTVADKLKNSNINTHTRPGQATISAALIVLASWCTRKIPFNLKTLSKMLNQPEINLPAKKILFSSGVPFQLPIDFLFCHHVALRSPPSPTPISPPFCTHFSISF